jgi:hypothetical protein
MTEGRATFTIGSDLGCDMVLADESVAPRHAQLEVRPNGPLILSDCGQAPQTKVVHHGEARPVRRAILTDDDRVRFGDLELSVPELIEALDLDRRLPGWRTAAGSPAPAGDRVSGVEADASRPPAAEAQLLPCGRCGRMTDSLKRHRLHRWVVFAWIAWWAQMADYTACPPCMRAILVRLTFTNLPGANVAWPIIAVINGWHLAASFRRGHSRRVGELVP